MYHRLLHPIIHGSSVIQGSSCTFPPPKKLSSTTSQAPYRPSLSIFLSLRLGMVKCLFACTSAVNTCVKINRCANHVSRLYSGVCHSDLGIMCNSVRRQISNSKRTYTLTWSDQWSALPEPTPEHQVGGHEGIGELVQLGPGNDRSNLKIGDRVGIKWIASVCGTCGRFLALVHLLNDAC